jgi:hypothetical protein
MATAAKFASVLDQCREMVFSHLRPLVDQMFENADVALLDFAEKAESNMAQSLFFEAMSEVRTKHKVIEQQFFARLAQGFTDFPLSPEADAAPADGPEPDALALVDTDTVESLVAIQNITAKLESRITGQIFALKQRLSVVNRGNAIERSLIPGGPAWLGAAFRHAIENSKLEHRIQLVFAALFDKYVLSRAETLFDEYNRLLVAADILPNLRYKVNKQPDRSGPGTTADGNAEQVTEPEPRTGTTTNEQHQSPSELGDEVFGRICELIAGQRRSATQESRRTGAGPVAQPNTRGVPGANDPGARQRTDCGTAPVSGDSLVGLISNVQQDVRANGTDMRNADVTRNVEVGQSVVEHLRTALAGEREQIYQGVDRRKVSGADTNVIELVGMLFEYMLEEEDLPDVVKALLSRLHTPLLKVAVMDRSFFTQQDHPARKLLDDMMAAGIRWVDEKFPERGILPRMRELVDRVLRDFSDDVGLFEEVHAQFRQAVGDLETRASRVEQRTNEAARGQEKLQSARARAHQEIAALAAGRPIAAAAVDSLQGILVDKLTFVLLRSDRGDSSDDWRSITALARRIVDSLVPPPDAAQRQMRQQELKALQRDVRKATNSVHRNDKEKLLDALFQAQQAVLDAGDTAHAAPVTPPSPAREDAAPTDKPTAAQQAMLDKLAGVPFGTWFEFSGPGKTTQHAKLSWRSTITQKFMFVDQMGVKAAVISIQELADAMLQGGVRIVTHSRKPFMDRALSAIHRMLDHAA